MNSKVEPRNELLQAETVLSTLDLDGSRRWIKPRLSCGSFWQRRRMVAYLLIVVFTTVPFLKILGKPLFLLDILSREFTVGGYTFLPTDTLLLAIFGVGCLLSIFLATAIFGRVWCGWACPQTVYLEFLFRPIERLLEGTVGRGGIKRKGVSDWRNVAKYVVYFFVCFYLANTFLAYFVGVERLAKWMMQSPLSHPVPFLVVLFVTFAMMVDFCFFREQTCLVACPYGRFQSVLLDENSLIVSYDAQRGETRGAARSNSSEKLGDCIDCRKCVTTCPTGIDIRDGLQMECINCTQCIDACNEVMDKIGRKPNLIRYSSQASDKGKASKHLRVRAIVYFTLILALFTAFAFLIVSKKPFDVVLLRELGIPMTVIDNQTVENRIRLKITNRSTENQSYRVEIQSPNGSEFTLRERQMSVKAGGTYTFHASIRTPTDVFVDGRAGASLLISLANNENQNAIVKFKLIGPFALEGLK